MSKRDEHDVADALLAKAVGDEAGLRALVDNHDVPDHVAGFLAQQAIEKAIKAVLIARNIPFERKHDIDYLCSLIEDAGLDLAPELSAAVMRDAPLNPSPPPTRLRSGRSRVRITPGAWLGLTQPYGF
ncbi:MAG TPA: HEPN domain-containing protein [Solirubrobacteraceae bacterium]|nr:HEPN domain-containing protein [Solirubrobacteraceae bacterium]